MIAKLEQKGHKVMHNKTKTNSQTHELKVMTGGLRVNEENIKKSQYGKQNKIKELKLVRCIPPRQMQMMDR